MNVESYRIALDELIPSMLGECDDANALINKGGLPEEQICSIESMLIRLSRLLKESYREETGKKFVPDFDRLEE